ncbi:3-dehydroquinate synthase family protein [Streptomyces sp. NPDC059611]|uniref:3-dehydroquinate synthase family protein n=1 Tax=Streptomyces sp. NPDC059611 TaxID=3346884 RepID=UPI0036CEEE89
MDHTEAAGEGVTLTPAEQGVRADIVRRDTTHLFVHNDGFAAAVHERIRRGAFILMDRNVRDAWPELSLTPGRHLLIDAGEKSKALGHAEDLIGQLHALGVSRSQPLAAVGGGTTTDLIALVAALYFRGVPLELMPTTLLGMIDAGIGGKCGVNHPEQKNLIGTFYQPSAVHIHLDALRTLPREDLTSALGEAVKIAVADDCEGLFARLQRGASVLDDPVELRSIVLACVATKLRLLGPNLFERDLARVLNLGHTVAHPLEDITSFRIPHGTAVAIGVAVASHISWQRGRLPHEDLQRILALLRGLGLPAMDDGFAVEDLIRKVDRLRLQRGGDSLHYVLPTGIGTTAFTDAVEADELRRAVAELTDPRGTPR